MLSVSSICVLLQLLFVANGERSACVRESRMLRRFDPEWTTSHWAVFPFLLTGKTCSQYLKAQQPVLGTTRGVRAVA